MSVDPVRKALYIVAVTVFLFVFGGYTPAEAFENVPVELSGLLLAQQSQDSADSQSEQDETDEYDEEDDEYADDDVVLIADPLYYPNVDIYHLNDKLYFGVLKPVAQAWGIFPEGMRTSIRHFMYNIRFPVRFINCALQGKAKKASLEFDQFFVNTTVGFLGLFNAAGKYPALQQLSREDMGQTFAVWGIGDGFYVMLPFLGPSSVRDAMGRVGDTFLDPIWWLYDDFWTSVAIRAGEAVNDTSLRIGEYEALKEAALDPYVMIRNAYVQNRIKLIAE
jgi:phospholipid-binding lipoprotein MlaA